MFPHGETVERLVAGTVTDPYSGEPHPSWAVTPTVTRVLGVGVEPRPTSEPVQDARNAVVSGFTLYLPPGTRAASSDRWRVRGEVYSAEGDPAVWRNPFTGWEPGVVVQVSRLAG